MHEYHILGPKHVSLVSEISYWMVSGCFRSLMTRVILHLLVGFDHLVSHWRLWGASWCPLHQLIAYQAVRIDEQFAQDELHESQRAVLFWAPALEEATLV